MTRLRYVVVAVWILVVPPSAHFSICIFFFFFQAEDGIRDATVTGVQTCALPISEIALRASDSPCGGRSGAMSSNPREDILPLERYSHSPLAADRTLRRSSARRARPRPAPGREYDPRSEERRVGKSATTRGRRMNK